MMTYAIKMCVTDNEKFVEDILTTVMKKKRGRHVMRRTDNRWTTKVTEWLRKNCRNQERHRTRWKDETTQNIGEVRMKYTNTRQKTRW